MRPLCVDGLFPHCMPLACSRRHGARGRCGALYAASRPCEEVEGVDMRPAAAAFFGPAGSDILESVPMWQHYHRLLGEPRAILELDTGAGPLTDGVPARTTTLSTCSSSGTLHCLVCWLEIHIGPTHTLSTGPLSMAWPQGVKVLAQARRTDAATPQAFVITASVYDSKLHVQMSSRE